MIAEIYRRLYVHDLKYSVFTKLIAQKVAKNWWLKKVMFMWDTFVSLSAFYIGYFGATIFSINIICLIVFDILKIYF